MTSSSDATPSDRMSSSKRFMEGGRHWRLQDAKARFSEVVRLANSDGPQHVTVHGREEVVIVSKAEFDRLRGGRTGEALVAAMQASPMREIDLEVERAAMPVRDIGW